MHALEACAEQTANKLVGHRLRTRLNEQLLPCLDYGFDPSRDDVAVALSEALGRVQHKVTSVATQEFSAERLRKIEEELRQSVTQDLRTGTWLNTFRGRDVLRRCIGQYGAGIPYEAFRDLVIARMRDEDHRPVGMQRVIDAILEDGR